MPESPSQVSPSSSNLKGALKPQRHAEQMCAEDLATQKACVIKTNGCAGKLHAWAGEGVAFDTILLL